MPPDREGAPQAGGKRKNTEPGGRSSPTHQKAVPTTASPHTRKFHSASAGLAAFHSASAGLTAEMRADNATLRMKNAALTVRLEVATKTVKRSKALAEKYYDLCVTSGVDAEVLNGVEEAEESDEEAEEPDEEAAFAVALFNASFKWRSSSST